MIIMTDRQIDRQTGPIEWVNMTKGVAMLMVIWGHVSLSNNIVLLLEQRTKDVPYMRYDKAKLPEFYLQGEKLEKIIAEMG